MCDCKTQLERRLLAAFKEKQPTAVSHTASLSGYGLAIIENTLTAVPFMEVKFDAKHQTKAGFEKWKTEKGTMRFSFCPFCGVSLQTQQVAVTAG